MYQCIIFRLVPVPECSPVTMCACMPSAEVGYIQGELSECLMNPADLSELLLQGHIKYTDAVLNNSKGEQSLTRLRMCTLR